MTSSSIPDGFSMGELEVLANAAATREAEEAASLEQECVYDGKTRDELTEIVDEILSASLEDCNDPMVHKLMTLNIISNMVAWHTAMGEQEFENGDTRSGACWLRDAGKFQSVLNILTSISVGPHDFSCPEE